MDKKMELLNNEKWLVEMAGIFDRVTGYRYIHLTTTNKEENLTYKSFTVPFDKVVDDKESFNEFTRYGLKRNEVKTVVQKIKEHVGSLQYEAGNDAASNFEDILEVLCKKIKAAKDAERNKWNIFGKDGILYYNIPNPTFKKWFEEEDFEGWKYQEFVRDLKVYGYIMCSKNRNDYKNTKDGIRGICLRTDKFMPKIEKENPQNGEEAA